MSGTLDNADLSPTLLLYYYMYAMVTCLCDLLTKDPFTPLDAPPLPSPSSNWWASLILGWLSRTIIALIACCLKNCLVQQEVAQHRWLSDLRQRYRGWPLKSAPPGISQVLTLIVTPSDLFAFVCSFAVIMS